MSRKLEPMVEELIEALENHEKFGDGRKDKNYLHALHELKGKTRAIDSL